jgi:hypothetical protein
MSNPSSGRSYGTVAKGGCRNTSVNRLCKNATLGGRRTVKEAE